MALIDAARDVHKDDRRGTAARSENAWRIGYVSVGGRLGSGRRPRLA
jgi:hypothetical protein